MQALIKKKILDEKNSYKIDEYPWCDLTNYIYTDNPRRSIVHARVHDPREVSAKLKNAEIFNTSFGAAVKTMLPKDLMADYIASHEELKNKKRRSMLNEDDSMSMELAEMSLTEQERAAAPFWSPPSQRKKDMEQMSQPVHSTDENFENKKVHHDVEAADKANQILKNIQTDTQIPEQNIDVTFDQVAIDEIKNKAWEESYQAGFNEGYTVGAQAGEEAGKVVGVQKGKDEGFESGFREGEERGVASAQTQVEKYFSTVAALLKELDVVKNEILMGGQEIFVEITKLCAEKIIREQLKFSDEALTGLFKAALENYSSTEALTIEMNSDDATRLRAQKDFALATSTRIKENPNLQSGDFKVEAKNEVVLVALEKVISNIVESLRNELFPKDETRSA